MTTKRSNTDFYNTKWTGRVTESTRRLPPHNNHKRKRLLLLRNSIEEEEEEEEEEEDEDLFESYITNGTHPPAPPDR